MDVRKYIDSGILELYVAGLLSEEENMEVYQLAKLHPEIEEEIEAIEKAVLKLTESVSANMGGRNFEFIKSQLPKDADQGIKEIPRLDRSWITYTGWAAAVVMAFGLLYFYNQYSTLENTIMVTSRDNELLKEQIIEARDAKTQTERLLDEIRDRNITVVPLAGQQASPESYARVYWNNEKDVIYLDAAGLPEPPDGMVYQVWSLKLSPLTPTSIGILDSFTSDQSKVFVLSNPNDSEAFGITLEPEGGSETPTLSRLYTLGATQTG